MSGRDPGNDGRSRGIPGLAAPGRKSRMMAACEGGPGRFFALALVTLARDLPYKCQRKSKNCRLPMMAACDSPGRSCGGPGNVARDPGRLSRAGDPRALPGLARVALGKLG